VGSRTRGVLHLDEVIPQGLPLRLVPTIWPLEEWYYVLFIILNDVLKCRFARLHLDSLPLPIGTNFRPREKPTLPSQAGSLMAMKENAHLALWSHIAIIVQSIMACNGVPSMLRASLHPLPG
jgi:hypothetical protein